MQNEGARTKKRRREYSRALLCVATCFLAIWCAKNAGAYSEILYPAVYAVPYRWFASTDPKNQNADYLLLKPGETRRIPLTQGRLLRLWSTSSAPEKTTLVLQNKKRIPLVQNGKARAGELYEKAFTLYPQPWEDTTARLAPSAALVVTNGAKTETKFFYQAAVWPTSTPPKALLYEKRDGKAEVQARYSPTTKKFALKPGEESAFWSASTRGAIRSVAVKFSSPPSDWNSVRLRAMWDENEKQHAIDVPLGAFAANFYQSFSSSSALWNFDGKSLTLRAAMPFGKGAKLTLRNDSTQNLRASTRVSF